MGNEKSVPLRFGRFKGNRIFAHKSIKVMAKNYLLETLREQKRMQLKGGIYHKVQIDRKHSKKCTLYAVGFDCSFALAITIKPK